MPGQQRARQTQGPISTSGLGRPHTVGQERGNAHASEQLPRQPSPAAYHRPTNIAEFTPAYVEAHREELGISPHTPTRDFFNEFIAHQVTGTSGRRSEQVTRATELRGRSNLNDTERAELRQYDQEAGMLEAWGYNPNVTADQEVMDDETGLYAVRFDPTDQGFMDGARSVTSFRGTQPDEGVLDFLTDADEYVGQAQYEANQAAIQGLIGGGTDDSTVTGHSLGGYLAQRAACDGNRAIGEVVTFQSGGLRHEDVERFDQQGLDIDVRHHTQQQDFVHLGGEQRLGGQTFHHHGSEAHFDHLTGMMFGNHDATDGILDVNTPDRIDEGVEAGWNPANRHLVEGMRRSMGSTLRHSLGTVQEDAAIVGNGLDSATDHVGSRVDQSRAIVGDALSGRRGPLASLGALRDTARGGARDVACDALRTGVDVAVNGQDGTRQVLEDANAGRNQYSQLANDGVEYAGEVRDSAVDAAVDTGHRAVDTGHRAVDRGRRGAHLVRDRARDLAGAGAQGARDAWHGATGALGSVFD